MRASGFLLLFLALAGCPDDPPLYGPPTESVCPPGSTLTWTSFGMQFMQSYCTKCHDSNKYGADRMGAPGFHDFDTLFGVKAVKEHVDWTTASGPTSTNTSMPPEGQPAPTLEERRMLGEWIACGLP